MGFWRLIIHGIFGSENPITGIGGRLVASGMIAVELLTPVVKWNGKTVKGTH